MTLHLMSSLAHKYRRHQVSEIDQELHVDTPPEPVEPKKKPTSSKHPKVATETERARAIVRAKLKR
jgi:hypothetical protein